MSIALQGGWSNFGNILAAVGALGTAAFGLVDATKAYSGGVSNIGYRFVKNAVAPYVEALKLVNINDPYAVIHANWLNGVAKSDQKAAVKSLIRLGLTAKTAAALAAGAPGADEAALQVAAAKIDAGTALTEQDIAVLGRFDAIIDAQLDTGFERADQQYRNAAKVIAAVFAVLLALVGVWLIDQGSVDSRDWILALFIGIISTPLAPVAKDLTSAIGTAVAALKAAQ